MMPYEWRPQDGEDETSEKSIPTEGPIPDDLPELTEEELLESDYEGEPEDGRDDFGEPLGEVK
jgi:hypothetical protein